MAPTTTSPDIDMGAVPSAPPAVGSPLSGIYFTDGGADRAGGGPGTVKRVNPDGTGLTTLVSSAGIRPRGITLDDVNGHLYWNDFGDFVNQGRTLRSDLDGSNVTTIVNHGQVGINDIALDIAAGKIYMALSVSASPFHGVRRVNFDGTGLVDLIKTWPPGSESPPGTFTGWFIDGLTVDPTNGHLYYGDIGVLIASGAPSGIVRTNLDGTSAVSVVPHLNGRGRGVALDLAGGKVYFAQHNPASSGNGNIWRANLDGTGLQVVVSRLQRPRDVTLDPFAGRVYWVDERTLKIQSANLDGSNVQDVVTGLDGPSSLALEFEREIKVELDIKPTSCPNPLNVNSKGNLPVAILGTDELDVNDIDVSTVQLEGVAPIRSAIEDVAAPVVNRQDDCDCTTDGPDGFNDLTLKFDTQEIVAALGPVNDGDEVVLALTGNLKDGTPIKGIDCTLIKSKGGKGGKAPPAFSGKSKLPTTWPKEKTQR
ncbi:hypothetical protein IH992_19630 [Candidatus Poribacteria bacterium]|nr:hypothetical protein [Candidatus Poribacteria bacterium]